jgi:hypothetical protein
MLHFRFWLCLCNVLLAGQLFGQKNSVFDPHETFKPVNYPQGNVYRSASGKPGSQYWQNQADYHIRADFDTVSRKLTAKMNMVYSNNSPDSLTVIWLSLAQNRFRSDSRTTAVTPVNGSRFGVQEFTEGFILSNILIKDEKNGKLIKDARTGKLVKDAKTSNLKKMNYEVMNDYLKITLPFILKPKAQIRLTLDYQFIIPYNGSDMMGILPTAHGAVYQFSAWFPRIVVYDNLKGWNTSNAGYYIEPGKLEYEITVPSGMIVQGTGKLLNPEQVLTKQQADRLKAAAKSETTITIRSAEEVKSLNSLTTQLNTKQAATKYSTWHFASDLAGDGLFAVSKAFIWDAVKVNLPAHKCAVAMSLYPVECNNPDWQESAQSMKQILESYSSLWYPYPYQTAVNIAGSVTGVGGPGASFIHYKSEGLANGVWSKTNHELGHSWFNMMICTNGRQAWMVEGLNSFINIINGDTLKRSAIFSMPDAIKWLSKAKPKEAVTTPYEVMEPGNFALLSYVKPAVALNLLRTEVLGKQRFDAAFKEFISAWAFKHPVPEDFFSAMENSTAEDLSWFWQSWFLNDWTLDQAIEKITYTGEFPKNGINIKVLNKGKMVMPVVVEVTEFNGKKKKVTLPVQVWQHGPEWTFHYPSTTRVISVKIDPDQSLPDHDLSNNTWLADKS